MSVYARIITDLLAFQDSVFGDMRSLFSFPCFFVSLNVYANPCALWQHVFFSWEGIYVYAFFSLFACFLVCVCVCVCVFHMHHRVLFDCEGPYTRAWRWGFVCAWMCVCLYRIAFRRGFVGFLGVLGIWVYGYDKDVSCRSVVKTRKFKYIHHQKHER